MKQEVRFGIIGTSKITDTFLTAALKHKDFRITAVYSRSEEKGRKFGEKYGVTDIFTDLEALAESNLIDAVYIASPNALHCRQTMLFLKHGKHVLCEKAFASNENEAKRMIDTARDNDVLLMEAVRNTAMPNFLAIKKNLSKIGTIRRVFAQKCQYSSRYDNYKKGIIENAFIKELSNGALMDIGVYCIHPILELFGSPEKVISEAEFLETGVDSQGAAILSYEGMNAVVMYSKISNSALPFEIQGEKGTLTASDLYDFAEVKIKYMDGSEEVISGEQEMDNMYYELDEFIKLVQNGKTESRINSLERTVMALQVMDNIRKQIGLSYPADQENDEER